MSASFHPEDSQWLLSNVPKGKLSNLSESIIYSTFDQQTSFDIQLIEKDLEEAKFLRRVCFYKLIMFVPEYFMSFLLFDKKFRKAKTLLAKLYYKFFRKEIDLVAFKKELKEISKEENF